MGVEMKFTPDPDFGNFAVEDDTIDLSKQGEGVEVDVPGLSDDEALAAFAALGFEAVPMVRDVADLSEYTVRRKKVSIDFPIRGKGLGRHVNHDSRSRHFAARWDAELPSVGVYNHARNIPVLDQGSLGSCTGNAAVGLLGTSPLYDVLPSDVRSKLNEPEAVLIYSAATKIDNASGSYPPTDTGSDGLSVAKIVKGFGWTTGYVHLFTLHDLLGLLQVLPIMVGVNWYEGFDNPDPNGHVSISGQVRGGHEFVLDGVDFGAQLVRACNSWGDGWGDHGHFTFSFADLQQLLNEYGDATALQPLTVPPPAPTPTPIPPSPTPTPDLTPNEILWEDVRDWVVNHKHSGAPKVVATALRSWAAVQSPPLS